MTWFNIHKRITITNNYNIDKIILDYTDYLIKWPFNLKCLNKKIKSTDSYVDEEEYDYWGLLFSNEHCPISFYNHHYYRVDKKMPNGLLISDILTKTSHPMWFLKYYSKQWSEQNKYKNYDFYEINSMNNGWIWESLFMNKNTPLWLFDKYKQLFHDKYVLEAACSNENIPIQFLENLCIKFSDECIIRILNANSNIPLEFYEKHLNLINDLNEWVAVCENPNVNIEFLEKYIDKLDKKCWNALLFNEHIPIWFLKKYQHKHKSTDIKLLNYICANFNVTTEFLEENIDKIIEHDLWESVFMNSNLPLSFIEKYIKYISTFDMWLNIYVNKNITMSFYNKYKKKFRGLHLVDTPWYIKELKKEEILAAFK